MNKHFIRKTGLALILLALLITGTALASMPAQMLEVMDWQMLARVGYDIRQGEPLVFEEKEDIVLPVESIWPPQSGNPAGETAMRAYNGEDTLVAEQVVEVSFILPRSYRQTLPPEDDQTAERHAIIRKVEGKMPDGTPYYGNYVFRYRLDRIEICSAPIQPLGEAVAEQRENIIQSGAKLLEQTRDNRQILQALNEESGEVNTAGSAGFARQESAFYTVFAEFMDLPDYYVRIDFSVDRAEAWTSIPEESQLPEELRQLKAEAEQLWSEIDLVAEGLIHLSPEVSWGEPVTEVPEAIRYLPMDGGWAYEEPGLSLTEILLLAVVALAAGGVVFAVVHLIRRSIRKQ